jgi:VWFA-related protein
MCVITHRGIRDKLTEMRWPVLIAIGCAALPSAVGTTPRSAQTQGPPFVERVEVSRILIDARVFDSFGKPIVGLAADDFAVEIAGHAVRVESAEWIGPSPAAERLSSAAQSSTPTATPAPGRLIVFLVQKSLEPLRITGLMQVGQLVDPLLSSLTRDDRVAVASFDSRLRLWSDFTDDVQRVRSILVKDVITGAPAQVRSARDVSLMSAPGLAADTKIFTIEHALRRIGEALEPLRGAKSVIVLGYGFGRWNPRSGDVTLMDGYEGAAVALQRARAAVFTLNVTQADFNSLQAGLQAVSADTGGTYASAYLFPAREISRLTQALAGYYVLFVEKPPLDCRSHRIDARLTRVSGTVMTRRTYVEPRC